MILIIGGYSSGKLEYVKNTLGYEDDEIAIAFLDTKPVLANLHDLIKARMQGDDSDIISSDELLEKLIHKDVITCNEVGCGVIPMTKEDRDYRELVGRISIELAKHAEKVIRIYSGIPTIIKDN